MDVTLIINGTDYSAKLSTYEVIPEIKYGKVITTLDHEEHFAPGHIRNAVKFSFWPLTDEEAAQLFSDLSQLRVGAVYTDPNKGADMTHTMRVMQGFEYAFGLRSIDGNRYYKGGTIELRQVGVCTA